MPVVNALCHCDDCKRRTGSAFGWSVYFQEADVALPASGFTEYVPAGHADQRRTFCTHCGSTLFWRLPRCPGMIGIAGGNFSTVLDEPNASYSADQSCAWLALPTNWRQG